MIDGVVVKTLKPIADERGFLMEILRSDDPLYQKFGQTYLTVVYPGVVKGWHYHKVQVDHFCAIKGMAKVVLYDNRDGSSTKGEVNEFFMGERNPILLRIPAGVLHGMKGIGTEPAYIVNTPTEPYNHGKPDEFRVHPHENDIPYSWDRRDG
jgi:dTDP-4-dehydrorhamnose 3,5-epimerase